MSTLRLSEWENSSRAGQGCTADWKSLLEHQKKFPKTRQSAENHLTGRFYCTSLICGGSLQCFLRDMMRSLLKGFKSSCWWSHINLKAAVSKEEPVTRNSWAGRWRCQGLVMLIPCRNLTWKAMNHADTQMTTVS